MPSTALDFLISYLNYIAGMVDSDSIILNYWRLKFFQFCKIKNPTFSVGFHFLQQILKVVGLDLHLFRKLEWVIEI